MEGRGGKSARWSTVTIRAEQENLVKLDGWQGSHSRHVVLWNQQDAGLGRFTMLQRGCSVQQAT